MGLSKSDSEREAQINKPPVLQARCVTEDSQSLKLEFLVEFYVYSIKTMIEECYFGTN